MLDLPPCTPARKSDVAIQLIQTMRQNKAPKQGNYVPTMQPHREPAADWAFAAIQPKTVKKPSSPKKNYNRTTRRSKNFHRKKFYDLMLSDANFAELIMELIKLSKLEEADEYGILRPTNYAFVRATNLIGDARLALEDDFPEATIGTDSEGGIHVHWTGETREITLVIPYARQGKEYIYHEGNDGFGIDKEVGELKKWIKWLLSA